MGNLPNGMRSYKSPAVPPYTHGPYEMSEGVAFNKPLVGFKRCSLVENYNHRPLINASISVISNLDFEVLGTNVADAEP